jgi:ABC-type multidrug transport system ATPase subunit
LHAIAHEQIGKAQDHVRLRRKIGTDFAEYLQAEARCDGHFIGGLTKGMYWKNLSCQGKVQDPDTNAVETILNNVSGVLLPGSMTLLVGGIDRGASKLLDVLSCQCANGSVSGEIVVDGTTLVAPTMTRFNLAGRHLISQVLREDFHDPHMTVREALRFSVNCRLPPTMATSAKVERVDMWLRAFQLDDVADKLLSDRSCIGSSEEKLISFALETICGHPVVLSHEPTNCLDTANGELLLKNMRDLTSSTQSAFMTTLRQPSDEMLDYFDQVIMLMDGNVAYFGPTRQVLPYLKTHGYFLQQNMSVGEYLEQVVIDPAQFGGISVSMQNLSEFQANATQRGETKHQAAALVREFEQSPLKERLVQTIQNVLLLDSNSSTNSSETENARLVPQGAPSHMSHARRGAAAHSMHGGSGSYWCSFSKFGWLLERRLYDSFRDYHQRLRVLCAITGGILIGYGYGEFGTSQFSGLSRPIMFYIICFVVAMYTTSSIPALGRTVRLHQRQWSQGYYSNSMGIASVVIAELPLTGATVGIFAYIVYVWVGLQKGTFLYFWLILVLLTFSIYSACGVAVTMYRSPTKAFVWIAAWFGLMNLVSGFLVAYEDAPVFWQWLFWISPVMYAWRGMNLNEFGVLEFECLHVGDFITEYRAMVRCS